MSISLSDKSCNVPYLQISSKFMIWIIMRNDYEKTCMPYVVQKYNQPYAPEFNEKTKIIENIKIKMDEKIKYQNNQQTLMNQKLGKSMTTQNLNNLRPRQQISNQPKFHSTESKYAPFEMIKTSDET